MEGTRADDRTRKEELPSEPPAPAPAAPVEVKVHGASALRCPYCHDDVAPEANDWVVCHACLARHHSECWAEARKCSTCGHATCLRAVGSAKKGRPHRTTYSVLRDQRLLPGERAGQNVYKVLGTATALIVYFSLNGGLPWGLAMIPFVWIAILLHALRARERDERLLRQIVEQHQRRDREPDPP